MTNRKIKNAQKNFVLADILKQNYNNIATVMICLHDFFKFGKQRLVKWFATYTELAREYAEYNRLEVDEVKIAKYLKALEIDYQVFVNVSKKRLSIDKTNPRISIENTIKGLADNLAVAFIHCNMEFGFGKDRLLKLAEYVANYKLNALEELAKIDVKIDIDDYPDIDEVKPKKEKIPKKLIIESMGSFMKYRRE